MVDTVFVNGQAQTSISVLDRGLLYGDSLFETIALDCGKVLMLEAHLQRLNKGAQTLGFDVDLLNLKQELDIFLTKNTQQIKNKKYVLRVTITRGEQSRGYKPVAGMPVTRILSLHEWPEYPDSFFTKGIKIGLSTIHYAPQAALAGIKHGNRLEQVLAAQTASNNDDDVLMLDQQQQIISSSKGNFFVLYAGEWLTPDLSLCGINGVIRSAILDFFSAQGVKHRVTNISFDEFKDNMHKIDAAFICNSIMGIVPIHSVLNSVLASSHHLCHDLRRHFIDSNVIAA